MWAEEDIKKDPAEWWCKYFLKCEWCLFNRDDNYALQMFDSMTTKNAKTYETMVLGFLKVRPCVSLV